MEEPREVGQRNVEAWLGVVEGESVPEVAWEGIDEGCQEGVVGQVWFEVSGEDVSKRREGVITRAEEVSGEVGGDLWWVAEGVTEAIAEVQDVSLRPEGG